MIKEAITEKTKGMNAEDRLVNVSGHLLRESEAFKEQSKELNKTLSYITMNSSRAASSLDAIEAAYDNLMMIRGLAERIEELLELTRSYGIENDELKGIAGKQMRMDMEE